MSRIKVWLCNGNTYNVWAHRVVRGDGGGIQFVDAEGETLAEVIRASDMIAWARADANDRTAMRPHNDGTAGRPATEKQRKFVADLIEQHPGLDCDVDPTEPGLTHQQVTEAVAFFNATDNATKA